MKRLLDLHGVSTPQLLEIKKVLSTGIPASAESLEDSEKVSNKEKDNMEDKERIESLEQEVKNLKGEKVTLTSEKETLNTEKETLSTEKSGLEEKASQVDTLTQELNNQKEELETLRQFKSDTDESAERAEKIKGIKEKLDKAELEADVETDADYWLSMTDETLDKTIAKMGELKKGAQASASIIVPPVGSGDGDDDDAKTIVSDGLKERKKEKEDKR